MSNILDRFLFTNGDDYAFSGSGWRNHFGSGIFTLAGDDVIIGEAISLSGNTFLSYGISTLGDFDGGGSIDTGVGNDLIKGLGTIGIENILCQIIMGAGDDEISGMGGDYGISQTDAKIITGEGSDLIRGGDLRTNVGIINRKSSVINSGPGDDKITGQGVSQGIHNTENSLILTKKGDDIVVGESARDFGIKNVGGGRIDTGGNNDKILGKGFDCGIHNGTNGSTIITGADEDQIIGEGDEGIYNLGSIQTDAGDDVITGSGRKCAIFNDGSISTGTGVDTVDGFAGGFRGSGRVNLGEGDDVLKGFGTGRFNGGRGFDRIILNDGTYKISFNFNDLEASYTIASQGLEMIVTSFNAISGVNEFPINPFNTGVFRVENGVGRYISR